MNIYNLRKHPKKPGNWPKLNLELHEEWLLRTLSHSGFSDLFMSAQIISELLNVMSNLRFVEVWLEQPFTMSVAD